MNLDFSNLATYSATRIAALLFLPALTSHTTVELARQIQRSKGIRMALWLGGGSLALALGACCTMELAAGAAATPHAVVLPPHLLQAACALAGCVWALLTLSRQRLQTGWVVASSLTLALGFTAMGDVSGTFRMRQNITAVEISILTFVVAAAAAYLFLKVGELAKAQQSSWGIRTLCATTVMGTLMAGSLLFTSQLDRAGALTAAGDFLAGGLPLTALCLGTLAVLVIALAATAISRQELLRTEDLQSSLDQQRMRDALAEQRVTRLQNEALLQEIQERQSAEGKLLFAAFHDAATGLENRASVSINLTETLKARNTQRHARPGVILINLDDLKSVNGLVGRATGDLVLLEVARRLQRFTNADDVLSRVGGDEFLLLMKHMPSAEHAMRKAHLMMSSIEQPIMLAGVVVNLCASMGLCEVCSNHHSAEDVFRDADTALQVAKREGGKQCKLFVPAMREEALGTHQRKMELKAAVETKQFVLYYQPFVDMRDHSIYGMEALIRWNHPTQGLVAPGAFIPLAEETGQILGIGLWTLQQSCHDFMTLQQNSSKDLLLSVNVSPRQLSETPFLKILREVLEETSMPPAQLQLELTESILIKDAASIGPLLGEIRSLGVKIAFDDFGTGYSSLSYLTRYPIDTLKVDQSFVRGMTQSKGAANLVLFMTALATEFNMSVTAEGVEEVVHETALLKQGCTFAQGYLYSRPVPLDAMIALLQQGLQIKPNKAAARLDSNRLVVSGPILSPAPLVFPTPRNR